MPASDSSSWDGRGLPPVAAERLARAASSGVATSLLSAAGAAGLAAVGFAPVGEVMGCIVEHIGWRGYGCGSPYAPRTITSASGNVWAGLGPYVKALYRGWDTALARLLAEATALGADGVVGVRLSETRLDAGGNREFLALGTAVRGNSRSRADRPFVTNLGGQDAAKLLHAGWVPTGIAVGISAAVRHDDYRTQQQAWSWTNTQVDGYTDLVNAVRHDARTQFETRARRHGGEAVMVTGMGLRVWEHEPSEGHRDHYAEATFYGTTTTQFHRGKAAPTTSLSILPLRGTAKEKR